MGGCDKATQTDLNLITQNEAIVHLERQLEQLGLELEKEVSFL